MLAVARLAQLVFGAAADHIHAVVDEELDAVDQAEFARLAVDDGQHDDAEADLQLRVLVEVVEHDFGLLAALQLEDDAHAVAVALVADVGDALDLLVVDQRGGVLDQRDLFTWYGISVTMICSRSLPIFSMAALARILSGRGPVV